MRFFKRLLRSSRKQSAAAYDDRKDAALHYDHHSPALERPRTAPHGSPGHFFPAQQPQYAAPPLPQNNYRGTAAAHLPASVLERIFGFVCPHALDDTYETAEETTTEGGCMLCDMRDLSRMALVSRRWNAAVVSVLYRCIRIDSVHYCGLEEELQMRRRRGSFFQRQKGPASEVPELRVRALHRTLSENEQAAAAVRAVKMPYMTRETCKADLAALLSLTPNLRYVDLPDGVASDDPSCASLKAALYARCPDLRKIAWVTGSEKNFVDLWAEPPWRGLEVMRLDRMRVENADLVRVLASLPRLHTLALAGLPWVSDELFETTGGAAPEFPPLRSLALEEMTAISSAGLRAYLERPAVARRLEDLTVADTPTIPVHELHALLPAAVALRALSYRASVARALDAHATPPLASRSLRTLRWELTDDPATKSLAKPAPSHYAYLATSLLSSSLPALSALYVRDTAFHDRLSTAHRWAQTLTIYSKGAEHLDWTKHIAAPPASPRSPTAINIQPVFEMPRNSLAADFSDPRMSILFAPGGPAVSSPGLWGEGAADEEILLAPPRPGFAEGRMSRPRSLSSASGIGIKLGLVGAGFAAGQVSRPSSAASNRGFGGFGGGPGSAGLVPPSPAFAKSHKKTSSKSSMRGDLWR